MQKINKIIASKLAAALSSMTLFWILTLLIWATILFQRPEGAQGWILFLVSVFFQGVSLPVLAFVSNEQGDRTEAILNETHDTVMSELAELRRMHEEQKAEIAELKTIHRELEAKLGRRAHDC
ncbi:hypothetical protein [Alicyclobacillus vulcanalis]|uniref:Uncharacterized protein n=1 Tax=Alicyclobacillus vulcanalis TaxID=252246 RepID=A0A1N7MQ31_9BACL|nr:hypothetical protein [Alicyclobacillus vulcanalis]SIS88041.1 hypothetical protein SAMN05421799_10612 [Alicyclobacillus vulcanalis]